MILVTFLAFSLLSGDYSVVLRPTVICFQIYIVLGCITYRVHWECFISLFDWLWLFYHLLIFSPQAIRLSGNLACNCVCVDADTSICLCVHRNDNRFWSYLWIKCCYFCFRPTIRLHCIWCIVPQLIVIFYRIPQHLSFRFGSSFVRGVILNRGEYVDLVCS